ncbi:BPI fold-containing family B member 3-like [Struthio camelus]|uniref:BPI fold-containing family B member 3-like n=1 Tax=Struthio camelus TaxID=8801 RepID=UPI003603C9DE
MLKVLGFILCGLLMSLRSSNAESTIISQEAYEKACEDSTKGLFESEMSKFTFPELKVDSIAIKGLYVMNVTILPIKAKCVPGVGVKVYFSALLSIFGTCGNVLVPGVVTGTVRLNCSALILLANYSPDNSSVGVRDYTCDASLIDVKISLSNVDVSVKAALRNNVLFELKNKTPKILSSCFSIGHRKLLHRINSVIAFETGKIIYVPRPPKVHNYSIEIPLQTQYETSDGKRIPIPSLPASPEVMLAANGTTETIGENTFTTILSRIVFEKPKTIPCTPETFPETRALEVALNNTIVSKCPVCSSSPFSLVVIVEVVTPLKVHLDVNLCTMNISLNLEIMSKKGNESLLVLAVLEAKLGLAATLHVTEGKVQFSAALDSLALSLVSSVNGTTDIKLLQEPLRAFVQEVIINEINSYLKIGKIPILRIPGLTYTAVDCRPAQRCIVCHNYHKKKKN